MGGQQMGEQAEQGAPPFLKISYLSGRERERESTK